MLFGPCLSFSSSKFKLILKRFGQKSLLFVRKNVLFRPKNHSQTIFIFFAFFNVFDRFSVVVQFGRFGCFAASFE